MRYESDPAERREGRTVAGGEGRAGEQGVSGRGKTGEALVNIVDLIKGMVIILAYVRIFFSKVDQIVCRKFSEITTR